MRINRTRRIIADMLKEHIGTSFLDSGGTPQYKDGCYVGSTGGYGRHFEKNQCRQFESELEAQLRFEYGAACVTLNIYHWLVERLEYEPKLDHLFHKHYVGLYDPNQDQNWHQLRRAFPEWLSQGYPGKWHTWARHYKEYFGKELGGLYGDGKPIEVNTYNDNDLLSQVMEYTYFTLDGDPYIILQIHNGADVRGGYTKPRIFSPSAKADETSIFDNAYATIICAENPDHNWYTDDAYHWYFQGTAGFGAGKHLEEYKIISADAIENGEESEAKAVLDKELVAKELVQAVEAGQLTIDNLPAPRADIPPRDFILTDDKDNGYCPLCGGKLEVCSI